LQVVWAGAHTLASASDKEGCVRMFNLETQDNYLLHLEEVKGVTAASGISCLAYQAR